MPARDSKKKSSIWQSQVFNHTVLGNSLAGQNPKEGLTTQWSPPSEAFALVASQLEAASAWPALPPGLQRAFVRAWHAVKRGTEILQPVRSARADTQAALLFLTSLTGQIRTLAPGEAIIVWRPSALEGERDGRAHLLYVVHRNVDLLPGAEFTVAVCTANSTALACTLAAPCPILSQPPREGCEACLALTPASSAYVLVQIIRRASIPPPAQYSTRRRCLSVECPRAELLTAASGTWHSS